MVHGAFLEFLSRTWCSSSLGTVFSGNLWSCLKEVKPLVMFDGECQMALEPMQLNQPSSRVDLGYRDLFPDASVNTGSL